MPISAVKINQIISEIQESGYKIAYGAFDENVDKLYTYQKFLIKKDASYKTDKMNDEQKLEYAQFCDVYVRFMSSLHFHNRDDECINCDNNALKQQSESIRLQALANKARKSGRERDAIKLERAAKFSEERARGLDEFKSIFGTFNLSELEASPSQKVFEDLLKHEQDLFISLKKKMKKEKVADDIKGTCGLIAVVKLMNDAKISVLKGVVEQKESCFGNSK